MPTLGDVAREVGVHPSTVSRALSPSKYVQVNPQTRTAIEEAARRLGYRPHMGARSLQSGRTSTVGVIAADLGNPFITPVIHGITASLEVAGIMPVIAETQEDHDRFARILDHMLSRRVDAVIALAARSNDRQILEDAGRIVPVVIAGRPLTDTSLLLVNQDEAAGARLAAEHLHALGHRRVVQLRGPHDVASFRYRADAFSEVCRTVGMTEVDLPLEAETPNLDEGRRLTAALLALDGPPPTAIFAHNDSIALGALAVLREHGLRVPEDVSIVGYNDLPVTELVTPQLTTVRSPSREIGSKAGEVVIRLLNGDETASVLLQPELIVRGSTHPVA